MTLLLGLLILALLLAGAPLFVFLGALALVLLNSVGLDEQLIAVEIYKITSSPNLIVIPLFAYTGVVMARSQMPRRFVELAQALVGWIPGAAALIALITFEFFTTFTGASGISILATGGMLFTVLRRAGYSERFSLGLISSAGSLGVLLPPSIVIIFYGTLSKTRIDELFIAGLLPSLLMLVVLGAYCVWRGYGDRSTVPFSRKKLGVALWAARYELPLPVLVLGGIYSGYFTVSEAACISALYMTIVEVGFYREISWRRDLAGIAVESAQLVGAIIAVLGVGLGLTNYFIDQGLPDKIVAFSQLHVSSRIGFLLSLNILLLLAGCVLDVFSALILLVPLLTPVAIQYGVNPIHLGIIFLANLEIGYSTPPVGLNLFVSSITFRRPLGTIIRAVLPFIVLLLLSVLIITFWPWLSTWAADASSSNILLELN